MGTLLGPIQQDSPTGQPHQHAGPGNNRDKYLITLKAILLNAFVVVPKRMLKQLIACSNNQLPATPTPNHPMFLWFQGKKG